MDERGRGGGGATASPGLQFLLDASYHQLIVQVQAEFVFKNIVREEFVWKQKSDVMYHSVIGLASHITHLLTPRLVLPWYPIDSRTILCKIKLVYDRILVVVLICDVTNVVPLEVAPSAWN